MWIDLTNIHGYLISKVKSTPDSIMVDFTLKIFKVEITLRKIYTISVSQLLLTGGQNI